jgi:hypothetical protein
MCVVISAATTIEDSQPPVVSLDMTALSELTHMWASASGISHKSKMEHVDDVHQIAVAPYLFPQSNPTNNNPKKYSTGCSSVPKTVPGAR